MFVKELAAIILGSFFNNKIMMILKELILISLNQEDTGNTTLIT